ncbi:MAG: hypothetical protein ACOCQR_03760 [bacterium]
MFKKKEDVKKILDKDMQRVEGDLEISKINLFKCFCSECNERIAVEFEPRVQNYPKFCPKCGANIEKKYDVDGYYTYRTLRLPHEENI